MRRAFTKAGAPATTALATRAELEARLKLRAKPAPILALTPKGPERAEVDASVASANERRIKSLTQRLEELRTGMKDARGKALAKDQARCAFAKAR